jgi:hypothetical protein
MPRINEEYSSVHERSEAPNDAHFAILEFDSIYIEGGTEKIVRYYRYNTEEAWKKAIEERANPKFGSPKDNFLPCRITPAKVTKSVHVSIS